MDGSETVVSRWREAGEWWQFEPYREFEQYLDAKGVRRERMRELPTLGRLDPEGNPYVDDATEEWSIRARKIRDEKVSAECGHLPTQYYEDRSRAFTAPVQRPLPTIIRRSLDQPYVPLHVHSGYAFGRSTLFAEEIAVRAAQAGCPAVAIADPFALTGAFEFVRGCKKLGIKPLVAATVEMEEGGEFVLIASTKAGYQSLSLLITSCHLGEQRGFPLCNWNRLERYSRDLLCLTGGSTGPLDRLLIRGGFEEANMLLNRLKGIFGARNVFVEVERSFLPWQIRTEKALLQLAQEHGLIPVAGGAITHARPENFPAQDILVCGNTLCTVEELVGRKEPRNEDQPKINRWPERALNAERYMRSGEEMQRLFADAPRLLGNTLRVAERCEPDVMPSRSQLPQLYENDPHALKEIVWQGALSRYERVSPKLKKRLTFELDRIIGLDFCRHFLVAHDFCRWADKAGIQMSGRGSVVDSVVAYCLGFSRIDALEHNLHFDRFLPADGSKRPDIDIDFEAHRRDDVRNYMTRKYGVEHVATVSAIGAFMTRGIIREVGKSMGLPDEVIGFLAKKLHGSVSADQIESAIDCKPELRAANIPKERYKWVFALANQLMDIPRNMRCHSSGVVISSSPIAETVPLMWSASHGEQDEHLRIMQWDKRSAKHCFDKFDILCLRGQDVLSGAQSRIQAVREGFDVTKVPVDDPETYRAMRSGELIGIPQSASPAMRQAHVRLRTENLHDASLVQAGIRPGVGGAVKINTLIRRRRGEEEYSFDDPKLEEILGITYGIIVFQEQVDQLLQTFGGYSSDQAEEIRDLIHKRRRESYGDTIREELINRVVGRGYSQNVAEQVFEYVQGFKGYGFAQGHALAFAEISIRSIYLQQNYPAEYFASLLDAQPAGYYGPCTIVNEARSRGIAILPIDVNLSREQFTVESIQSKEEPNLVFPQGAIRVGLRQVLGLSKRLVEKLEELHDRGSSKFASVFEFAAQTNPDRDDLERLILCGAFDSLHTSRRQLLWAVPKILSFAHASVPAMNQLPFEVPIPELPIATADFCTEEKAVHERAILGVDIEHHLMAFERERVSSRGGITARECQHLTAGRKAIVVGNPIRLRFPPTPSGKRVVFFDLEDESGLLNVTCFDAVYQRDGHAIICSGYVTVIGEVQDRDGHKAFLAHRVFSYQPLLEKKLTETQEIPVVTADFLVG